MSSLSAYQLRLCARAGAAYILSCPPGVLYYSLFVVQQGSSAGVQSIRDALSNGSDGKLYAVRALNLL